jgi:membrane fusion protein (multidrug efflux system)
MLGLRRTGQGRRLLAALLLMTVVGMSGCGADTPSAGPPGAGARAPGGPPGRGGPMAPVKVVAATVELRDWVDRVEALGTAYANESVTLTAKVTETVSSVNFRDNQEVETGAILVELTDRAEVANLREAQAAYEDAERQYRRLLDLQKQGTIGQAQLEQQQSARDQARARVQAIRARLSDRVITAPFAGQLGMRRVSPGTLVTPGTVITTLDDIATIKVDFSVPETFLAAVKVGEQIRATSAAWRGQSFEGAIESIDSRVNPVTRAVIVRARLPNPERKLKPGMLLSVELQQAPRQTLVIDELAIVQLGRQAFVFRINADNTVQQVPVEIGARRPGEVEIVAGLNPGDRIVVEGTVKLRNGLTVDPGTPPPAAPVTPAPAAS